MEGKDTVEAIYRMLVLVDMTLGQRIEQLGFNLVSVDLLDTLNVGERPPITKLANAQHHAPLLITIFLTENKVEFTPIYVMKVHVVS